MPRYGTIGMIKIKWQWLGSARVTIETVSPNKGRISVGDLTGGKA
jgi:hypothetical protein